MQQPHSVSVCPCHSSEIFWRPTCAWRHLGLFGAGVILPPQPTWNTHHVIFSESMGSLKKKRPTMFLLPVGGTHARKAVPARAGRPGCPGAGCMSRMYLRGRHGSRHAMTLLVCSLPFVEGGTDVATTYFCRIRPPKEWATTTGGRGKLEMRSARSVQWLSRVPAWQDTTMK